MELAPRVSISVSFGGGQPVDVEYSFSLTEGNDTPQHLLIHKAESAGVDLMKSWAQPDIDALKEAVIQHLNL